jgi:hypothetical protein
LGKAWRWPRKDQAEGESRDVREGGNCDQNTIIALESGLEKPGKAKELGGRDLRRSGVVISELSSDVVQLGNSWEDQRRDDCRARAKAKEMVVKEAEGEAKEEAIGKAQSKTGGR